eukprot:scaffold10193_cov107-Isochrysis_galbana.AAC.2
MERHALALYGEHGGDEHAVVKVELGNALEALLQMGLHAEWVFGLRQDLEQLVVGEEKEAGERQPLGLQVVVEPFLDELQFLIGLAPRGEQTLLSGGEQHVRLGYGLLHHLAPQPVDLCEALGLLRHLAHDVLRREDGLEVEPDRLAFDPLVDNLLHRDELGLPLMHPILKRLYKGRAAHRLRFDNVVVEQPLHIVEPAKDMRPGVTVGQRVEGLRSPLGVHLVERLLERELLGGRLGHVLDGRQQRVDLLLQHHRECRHAGRRLERPAGGLTQRTPVPVAQTWVEHRRDEGQVLLELVQLGPHVVDHLQRPVLPSQLLGQLVQRAPPIVDVALYVIRHKLHEWALHPRWVGQREGAGPGRLPAEELLARRIELGQLLALGQLVGQRSHVRRVLLHLRHALELDQSLDLELARLELLLELLLVAAELVLEKEHVRLLLLVGRVDLRVDLARPRSRRVETLEGGVGQRASEGLEHTSQAHQIAADCGGHGLEPLIAGAKEGPHLDHCLRAARGGLQPLAHGGGLGCQRGRPLTELVADHAGHRRNHGLRLCHQRLAHALAPHE